MEKIKYSMDKDIKGREVIRASFRGVLLSTYPNMEKAEKLAPLKLQRMKDGYTDKHIQEILIK